MASIFVHIYSALNRHLGRADHTWKIHKYSILKKKKIYILINNKQQMVTSECMVFESDVSHYVQSPGHVP